MAVKKTAKRKPAGNAGKGRRKGSKNLVTSTVKDAIAGALNAGKGAQVFFEDLKKDDPRAFATIAAKLIPVQLDIDATIDNHITFKLIK